MVESFAAPQNCASMSQLNVSRFMEPHDLAAQGNVQSSIRGRDLNEVRVYSFVCYRFAGRACFHVNAPSPGTYGGFGAEYVSKAWFREKLSTAATGIGELGSSSLLPYCLRAHMLSRAN